MGFEDARITDDVSITIRFLPEKINKERERELSPFCSPSDGISLQILFFSLNKISHTDERKRGRKSKENFASLMS